MKKLMGTIYLCFNICLGLHVRAENGAEGSPRPPRIDRKVVVVHIKEGVLGPGVEGVHVKSNWERCFQEDWTPRGGVVILPIDCDRDSVTVITEMSGWSNMTDLGGVENPRGEEENVRHIDVYMCKSAECDAEREKMAAILKIVRETKEILDGQEISRTDDFVLVNRYLFDTRERAINSEERMEVEEVLHEKYELLAKDLQDLDKRRREVRNAGESLYDVIKTVKVYNKRWTRIVRHVERGELGYAGRIFQAELRSSNFARQSFRDRESFLILANLVGVAGENEKLLETVQKVSENNGMPDLIDNVTASGLEVTEGGIKAKRIRSIPTAGKWYVAAELLPWGFMPDGARTLFWGGNVGNLGFAAANYVVSPPEMSLSAGRYITNNLAVELEYSRSSLALGMTSATANALLLQNRIGIDMDYHSNLYVDQTREGFQGLNWVLTLGAGLHSNAPNASAMAVITAPPSRPISASYDLKLGFALEAVFLRYAISFGTLGTYSDFLTPGFGLAVATVGAGGFVFGNYATNGIGFKFSLFLNARTAH